MKIRILQVSPTKSVGFIESLALFLAAAKRRFQNGGSMHEAEFEDDACVIELEPPTPRAKRTRSKKTGTASLAALLLLSWSGASLLASLSILGAIELTPDTIAVGCLLLGNLWQAFKARNVSKVLDTVITGVEEASARDSNVKRAVQRVAVARGVEPLLRSILVKKGRSKK